MKKIKRYFAVLLSVLMIVSSVPLSAFAAGYLTLTDGASDIMTSAEYYSFFLRYGTSGDDYIAAIMQGVDTDKTITTQYGSTVTLTITMNYSSSSYSDSLFTDLTTEGLWHYGSTSYYCIATDTVFSFGSNAVSSTISGFGAESESGGDYNAGDADTITTTISIDTSQLEPGTYEGLEFSFKYQMKKKSNALSSYSTTYEYSGTIEGFTLVVEGSSETTYVDEDLDKYVFAYFTGNETETQNLYLAVSDDGYNFEALNGNNAVWTEDSFDEYIEENGEISVYPSGLSDEYYCSNDPYYAERDPYIFEAEDGSWYILATDLDVEEEAELYGTSYSTNNLLTVWHMSELGDLSNAEVWFIDIQAVMYDYFTSLGYSTTINRAWAPEAIWDPDEGAYLLIFAVANSGWASETGAGTIMYGVYTTDFQSFTEPQVLLPDQEGDTIDGNITYSNGYYVMWFKDESNSEIGYAVSGTADGPYTNAVMFEMDTDEDGAEMALEGPEIYQLEDSGDYILIADYYASGTPYIYSFKSTDAVSFTANKKFAAMNINHLSARHGSVANCSTDGWQALIDAYGVSNYDSSTVGDDEDVNDYLVARYFTTADGTYDATGHGYTLDTFEAEMTVLDGTVAASFLGDTTDNTIGGGSTSSSGSYTTNGYSYASVATAEMATDYDFNLEDGITIAWYGYSNYENCGRWFDWLNLYDSDSGSFLDEESSAGLVVWNGSTYSQNSVTNLYVSSAYQIGSYNLGISNIIYDNMTDDYGDEWHEYAISVTNGYVNFWVDGALIRTSYYITSANGTPGTVSSYGSPFATDSLDDTFIDNIVNGILYFGVSAYYADEMLNGYISDFRIYNKALNTDDLTNSAEGLDSYVPTDSVETDEETGYAISDYLYYDPYEDMDTTGDGEYDKTAYDTTIEDEVNGYVLDATSQVSSSYTYYGTLSDNSTTDSDAFEGYTIAFWYYPTGNDESEIFSIGDDFTVYEGSLVCTYGSSDISYDLFGDYEFSAGDWVYIVIQIEENTDQYDTIYAYVDGVLQTKVDTFVAKSTGEIGTVGAGNSLFVYLTGTDLEVTYGGSADSSVALELDEFYIYDDIYSASSLYTAACYTIASHLVQISEDKYVKTMQEMITCTGDEESGYTYTNNGYVYTNMTAAYEAYDAILRYKASINNGYNIETVAEIVTLYQNLLDALDNMEEYTAPESYEGLTSTQTNANSSVDAEYTNNMLSTIDLTSTTENEGTSADEMGLAVSSTAFVWLYTGLDDDIPTAPIDGASRGNDKSNISWYAVTSLYMHDIETSGNITDDPYANETASYTVSETVDLTTSGETFTADEYLTETEDGVSICFTYTAAGTGQTIFTIGSITESFGSRYYLSITESGGFYYCVDEGSGGENYIDLGDLFGEDVTLSADTEYNIIIQISPAEDATYDVINVYLDYEQTFTYTTSSSDTTLSGNLSITEFLAQGYDLVFGKSQYWTASSSGTITKFAIYNTIIEIAGGTLSFGSDTDVDDSSSTEGWWTAEDSSTDYGFKTGDSLDWIDPDDKYTTVASEPTTSTTWYAKSAVGTWTLMSNYLEFGGAMTSDGDNDDDDYLGTLDMTFGGYEYYDYTIGGTGTSAVSDVENTGTIYVVNYYPVYEVLTDDALMEVIYDLEHYTSSAMTEIFEAYDALTSLSYYTSVSKVSSLVATIEELVAALKVEQGKEDKFLTEDEYLLADYTTVESAMTSVLESIISASSTCVYSEDEEIGTIEYNDDGTYTVTDSDGNTYESTDEGSGAIVAETDSVGTVINVYDTTVGYTTDNEGNTYNYTSSSWANLITAYQAVKDYYTSLDPFGDNNDYLTAADQTVVDNYTNALVEAANTLVVAADFDDVEAATDGITTDDDGTVTVSTDASAQAAAYVKALGDSYEDQTASLATYATFADDFDEALYYLSISADIPLYSITYTATTDETLYYKAVYVAIDENFDVVTSEDQTPYYYTFIEDFYEEEGDTAATLDNSGCWIQYDADGDGEAEWYDVTGYRYYYSSADIDYTKYSDAQVGIYKATAAILGSEDDETENAYTEEGALKTGYYTAFTDITYSNPTITILSVDDEYGDLETDEEGNIVTKTVTVSASEVDTSDITSSYTALESIDCEEGYEAYDKAWSYFEKIDPDAYVSEEVLERYGSTDGGYYTYEDGELVVADDEEATIGSGAVYVEYESNVTGETGTYYYTSSITENTTNDLESTDYYTYRILSFLGGYEIESDDSISTEDYSSYQTYKLTFEVYVDGKLDESLGSTNSYRSGTSVTLKAPTESSTETDDDDNAITYTVAAWSKTVNDTTSALAGIDSSYTLAVTKDTTVAVYVTSSTCETIEVTYADAVNAKYQVVYVESGTTYDVSDDGTITFTTDDETVATLSHTLPSYYDYSNTTVSGTEVTSGTITETTTFVANGKVSHNMVYYVIDAVGAGDTVSISNSTDSTATVTSGAVANGSNSYNYAYTTAVLDDVVTVTVGGKVDDCGKFLGIAMYYNGAFYMVSYSNTVTLYAFDVANGFAMSDSYQIYEDLELDDVGIESGRNVVAFIPVYEEFFDDSDYSTGILEISVKGNYSINYETVGSAETVIPQIVSVGVYDSADSIFNVYCNVTQDAKDATIVEKGILYSRTADEDDTLVKDGTDVSVAKDGSALTETNYSFSISVSNNATYGTTLYVRGYVSYQITVSEYKTASGTDDDYEDDKEDKFTMTLISYSNILCTDDC